MTCATNTISAGKQIFMWSELSSQVINVTLLELYFVITEYCTLFSMKCMPYYVYLHTSTFLWLCHHKL